MNEAQRAEALRLAAFLKSMAETMNSNQSGNALDAIFAPRIEKLRQSSELLRTLAEQPAREQELVAWMWKNTNTDGRGVYFEDPSRFFDIAAVGDYEWTHLYAAPVAQQPPKPSPEVPQECTTCGALVVVVAAPVAQPQEKASEDLPWLLPVDAAVLIGNMHRVRVGAVQAVAKQVYQVYEQRVAQPLTDEQIDVIADKWFSAANMLTPHQWRKFARAILAAAGAKP
jgi:hypothetical protein